MHKGTNNGKCFLHQEAVLKLLEKKHIGEQELLMQLLGDSRNDEDIYLKASAASEQERQDLQDDLRERYKKVSPGKNHCLFIYLFVCLSMCLFFHLFVNFSVSLFVCVFFSISSAYLIL